MFNREINLSQSRSFFLFGARGTGKTTLLNSLFPRSQFTWIDLLDLEVESRLQSNPKLFLDLLPQNGEWVIIDEVQKMPELLNYVHQLIQQRKYKFALTGSSARKLKRGGANLLAGRASWFELFPLNHRELAETFDLKQVMEFGSLPEVFNLKKIEKVRFLRAYAHTYLKEEILQEQLIRKVQPFRNFLELAALNNGQLINYSKFAQSTGVEVPTIQTYYEILVDTLLGFSLLPFHESVRKRQRKNPKFYFFDTGVARALSGELETKLVAKTSYFGQVFEQWLISEIYSFIRTQEKDWKLSYLQTSTGSEIDLIIEKNKKDRLCIEIKSTDKIDQSEVKSLETLASEIKNSKLYYLSNDPLRQKVGKVDCMHWRVFFDQILS